MAKSGALARSPTPARRRPDAKNSVCLGETSVESGQRSAVSGQRSETSEGWGMERRQQWGSANGQSLPATSSPGLSPRASAVALAAVAACLAILWPRLIAPQTDVRPNTLDKQTGLLLFLTGILLLFTIGTFFYMCFHGELLLGNCEM